MGEDLGNPGVYCFLRNHLTLQQLNTFIYLSFISGGQIQAGSPSSSPGIADPSRELSLLGQQRCKTTSHGVLEIGSEKAPKGPLIRGLVPKPFGSC